MPGPARRRSQRRLKTSTPQGEKMKKIPLTQGQFALVDDGDFSRFSHLKWCAYWAPKAKTFYAKTYIGGGRKKAKYLFLHRAIMGVTDPKIRVDHRNHDGLHCRRFNLRVCTHAQNMMNRRGPTSKNTSGMRGVSWAKNRGKWKAEIKAVGKRLFLGHFINKMDAAAAYAAANRKHFGEFGGGL